MAVFSGNSGSEAFDPCRETEKNVTIEARMRVLYGDTDAMGHAYYGNYMKWFEVGRAEWFRSRGMSYRELEGKGIFLPVIEAHCSYRKPAYYDDILIISTAFQYAGPARIRFDFAIRRGPEEVLAEGYTIHACTDRDRKVMRPPKYLRELLGSSVDEPMESRERFEGLHL